MGDEAPRGEAATKSNGTLAPAAQATSTGALASRPYSQCLERLRLLVGQLEDSQVDVDALAGVVQESVELIATCRERLRATQSAVDNLLSGLTEQPASAAGPSAHAPPPAPPRRRSPPVAPKLGDALDDLSDPFAE